MNLQNVKVIIALALLASHVVMLLGLLHHCHKKLNLGIFWFEGCGTSNISKPGSAIIEIEKEGIMDLETRAFRNYPSERRPFSCQTVVSIPKPPSVIRIPPRKPEFITSRECKGKEEQKNRKKAKFFQRQRKRRC